MTSLKIMFATGAIVGALAGQVAACPQDGRKASLGASRKEIVESFSTSFPMVIRWRKKLC
ncbi:hypothetical protein [Ensifer sp. 22460]|uniref:hypothetical protein n=1 Tax=Ensifer sp. 22460 TaxID=3453922 RepID=UPI003F826AD1